MKQALEKPTPTKRTALALIKKAMEEEDAELLIRYLFNIKFKPTPGQIDIVKKIAFGKVKRLNINAMTRYGKTFWIAVGILIFMLLNPGTKNAIISATNDQAQVAKRYFSDLILSSPIFIDMMEINVTRFEQTQAETSRTRQTFKNRAEYQVYSAEGEGKRLLAHGVTGIVWVDESSLVNRESWIKINRMLGDNPEETILIQSANPWEVDSVFYDDWQNPRFETIHIGWRQAVREGRTTVEYIEEMRERNTSLAFTVLYESKFPDMAEDAIFDLNWIDTCGKNKFKLWNEYKTLKKRYESEFGHNPLNAAVLLKRLKDYRIIVCCDPADMGLDFTVIYWGVRYGNEYQLIGAFSEATSDNNTIGDKMWEIGKKIGVTHFQVDGHGLGTGVLSRLKALRTEHDTKVIIKSCLFGQTAQHPKHYKNQKAENYFRLMYILKDGRIDLPSHEDGDLKFFGMKLRTDLMKMKWERPTNKEYVVILDPEKSPDYADALVYFVWQDKSDLRYAFLETAT